MDICPKIILHKFQFLIKFIMSLGRPIQLLNLSPQLLRELQAIDRSRSLPRALVQRAQIILLAADGLYNTSIAAQLGVSAHTVGLWRRRFLRQGITGLYGKAKPGGPHSISDEEVATLIRKTLETKPQVKHRTVRALAAETKLSKSTAHRILQAYGLPHRKKHFMLSSDPLFAERVLDIVGLYLNPPDLAMVLCVNEKSQIQAQDRIHPGMLQGSGYVEGETTYHVRSGITTLSVALDIASGQVSYRTRPRYRYHEFLRFLQLIDSNVPENLAIHSVGTLPTHKNAKVKRWLADRPRYHMHFTPSYSFWLNQMEIWFNVITQKAVRRGTFRSVKRLTARIDSFVDQYDAQSQPFMWWATAKSILEKLPRVHYRDSGF